MCTGLAETAQVSGSGKGPRGWFKLEQVSVSYDHPSDAPPEYTLNIDFVSQTEGPSARVAVELTAESAKKLVQTILTTLSRAGIEVNEARESGSIRTLTQARREARLEKTGYGTSRPIHARK